MDVFEVVEADVGAFGCAEVQALGDGLEDEGNLGTEAGGDLERIEESEHKADAPQDRVQLFFSTHDVTLCGWRLRDFLRSLRKSKVAAVKTGEARYANLRNDLPFVAEIKIAPVETQE